jgi:ferric-dicitrate binding protein FerR (iron transport regulator)
MIPPDITAAACRWLVELETAESLDEIWPKFESWLHQNPEHEAAYLRVEQAWHDFEALRQMCPKEGTAEAAALLGIDEYEVTRGVR